MYIIKWLFILFGIILFVPGFSQAAEPPPDRVMLIPEKIAGSIKIDGILNETAWKSSPTPKRFTTFAPVFGQKLEQETKIWLAYDQKNLYFAFKCLDLEPHKIKTSISKRDNVASFDDSVGVIIDTMGNRQTSYEFYVNPNGIQEDALTSAVNGWSYDNSPDYVWQSAGKIVDDGYQVEIRIPFDSIRFKSGDEIKMGIIFIRNVSRLGKLGSWPEIKAGQTQFNSMATVVYKGIQKGLLLEILPNLIYSKNKERKDADSWKDADALGNVGVSVKYGITSSIIGEATIKPDFSQVESDAFQAEVNLRYPIFYSEKRPFFMEGLDVFDFGLISDGMMISAVHTRRIVDPDWAVKLSGTSGKILFSLLTANDNAPGQAWETGINPNEGKNTLWGIARAKYSLGSDNSLGILYSGRHFAGGTNNVAGADFQYRFLKNTRFKLSYLHSNTKDPGGSPATNGGVLNVMMEYSARKLDTFVAYERYSRDFTMYSAFMNRVGISRTLLQFSPNFFMKKKLATWIQKIQPYLQFSILRDLDTQLDDTSWKGGVNMYFTRSGYFRLELRHEKEAWMQKLYTKRFLFTYGNIQLFKWFNIQGYYGTGEQIYYNSVVPQLGIGVETSLGFTLQPSVKLSLNMQWTHSDLKSKEERQKLYSVNIFNLYSTYQFNKHFFIRAAVRYNDSPKKLLTDFLASFTLIPGTVMHLGYGSLYEQKEWQNNQWTYSQGGLLNMKNGLFFKVSYLWRIK